MQTDNCIGRQTPERQLQMAINNTSLDPFDGVKVRNSANWTMIHGSSWILLVNIRNGTRTVQTKTCNEVASGLQAVRVHICFLVYVVRVSSQFLAAVEAIKHFCSYLYGQFFIIETDISEKIS
mgnify:CR=1 FL=1